MVRNYQRKTKTKYSNLRLISAAECVKREGCSIRLAAKKFSIPFSTLRRAYQRSESISLETSLKTPGRSTIFNSSQERSVVSFVVSGTRTMQECLAFAYNWGKVCNANIPISWKRTQMAGIDWLHSLLERYPVAGLFIKSGKNFMRANALCCECRRPTEKLDVKFVCWLNFMAVCVECEERHDCLISSSDDGF